MNSLPNISNKEDELWLANHDVIDLLKNILIENKGGYIPGHVLHQSGNLGEYLNIGLEDETRKNIGYSIILEVLEILYQPDKDALTIKYNGEGDKQNPNITHAVGQANMILNEIKKDFSGKIYTLLAPNPENDVILIEEASKL